MGIHYVLKNHHFVATCEILRLGWELWEKHFFIIFIFSPIPCQFCLPNIWFLKIQKRRLKTQPFDSYLVMWVYTSPCRFHSLCGICPWVLRSKFLEFENQPIITSSFFLFFASGNGGCINIRTNSLIFWE